MVRKTFKVAPNLKNQIAKWVARFVFPMFSFQGPEFLCSELVFGLGWTMQKSGWKSGDK